MGSDVWSFSIFENKVFSLFMESHEWKASMLHSSPEWTSNKYLHSSLWFQLVVFISLLNYHGNNSVCGMQILTKFCVHQSVLIEMCVKLSVRRIYFWERNDINDQIFPWEVSERIGECGANTERKEFWWIFLLEIVENAIVKQNCCERK